MIIRERPLSTEVRHQKGPVRVRRVWQTHKELIPPTAQSPRPGRSIQSCLSVAGLWADRRLADRPVLEDLKKSGSLQWSQKIQVQGSVALVRSLPPRTLVSLCKDINSPGVRCEEPERWLRGKGQAHSRIGKHLLSTQFKPKPFITPRARIPGAM